MPRCAWPARAISPRSSASTEDQGNFVIGYTREQGHPVCLNLEKFVQRSSGVFGATGTGKSFLTRIILAGLIQYNKASVLVFDMHNEYGFDDTASDTGAARGRAEDQVPQPGAGGRPGPGRHDPRQRARFQPGDRRRTTSSPRISSC